MNAKAKRIEAYIQRARSSGSSATTLRGAGRYLLSQVRDSGNYFHRGFSQWRCPAQIRYKPQYTIRNERLIARYAGRKTFPWYLNAADRATIKASDLHRDLITMRSKPSYVRAFYITGRMFQLPRLSAEIAKANREAGKLAFRWALANHAHDSYPWGARRVHCTGKCVEPQFVGMAETGSNRDWTKRSTLQRYAHFCHVVPQKHGPIYTSWYLDATRIAHVVYNTPNYIKIKGESTRRRDIPSAKQMPLPIHIQRRLLEMATPSVLTIGYDRESKLLTLSDATGEVYHVRYVTSVSAARGEVHSAIQAFRKRRAEKLIDLQAGKAARVFVALEDSYGAGNCKPMSDRFASTVWQQIGAIGPCAVRADVILAARHDAYTQRACAYAASRYV